MKTGGCWGYITALIKVIDIEGVDGDNGIVRRHYRYEVIVSLFSSKCILVHLWYGIGEQETAQSWVFVPHKPYVVDSF